MKLDYELIKGSFILLIVFNLYSLINFLFQASMARTLSLADYGILMSLSYLIYLSGIFAEPIQTILAKYSATESDKGRLKNILSRSFKKFIPISLIIFVFYIIIIIPLSILSNIPYLLWALNGIMIFPLLFLPITRGILQGRKKFFGLGISLLIESIVKIVIAIILVLIGWKVYGAVAGILIGLAISLVFSFLLIKNILSSKEKPAKVTGIYNYSLPVFLASASVLAFYTLDLFIAPFVFPKEIAGYYSVLSILSKIVFWGTQPISKAMFPISVERTTANNKSRKTYLNSLMLVLLGIIFVMLLFYLFPEQIIKIFSGKIIPEGFQPAALLLILGFSTSLFSLANLNILHNASKEKIVNSWMFPVFFVIGALSLIYFSRSLLEFSLAFLTIATIFLLGSIVLVKE